MPRKAPKKFCETCQTDIGASGFAKHTEKHEREAAERDLHEDADRIAQRIQNQENQGSSSGIHNRSTSQSEDAQFPAYPIEGYERDADYNAQLDVGNEGQDFPENGYEEQHPVGTIKIVYHPHSKITDRIVPQEDFRELRTPSGDLDTGTIDNQPWRPFPSRLDFEYAEHYLELKLNESQIDKNLELHRRASNLGSSKLTMQNHSDLQRYWELASEKLADFVYEDFSVSYDRQDYTFTVQYRSLWDWAMDLVQDEKIGSSFTWNAEKLYRWNGNEFVHFVDEPWTGNMFWSFQSSLPEDGVPLAYIIYADKNKLSSFGTAKGYPVIARLAQIPVDVRNGPTVFGGPRIIGWLPLVEDRGVFAGEGGKQGFTQFKQMVYHEAFRRILSSLVSPSKYGAVKTCGDGFLRRLFPTAFILSGDYEELCAMTLIRGSKGLFPCPICLIPLGNLSDHSFVYPLRNASDNADLLGKVSKMSAVAREETLKEKGLRYVENAFNILVGVDLHKAVSFDRMHANPHGKFGRHLLPALNLHIDASPNSRRIREKIDKGFDQLPRWRGLNHFDKVIGTAFNDASKYEDISKQLIFAAHDAFPDQDIVAYQLLRAIRAYIEADIYLSFTVHTADTISAGRSAVKYASECINEYVATSTQNQDKLGYEIKSWNFPKAHLDQHAFDDIETKGVTRNYNTKIPESMHRFIREVYQQMSNFKTYVDTILNTEHCAYVALYIRTKLDELDEHLKQEAEENQESGDDIGHNYSEGDFQHAYLGSKQQKTAFDELENKFCGPHLPVFEVDHAYKNFRTKLAAFLNRELPKYPQYPLPPGRRVVIKSDDEIVEYRLMKVYYEHKVDWSPTTDILRCSPMFYNHPRYDAVMINVGEGKNPIFGRLIFMFKWEVEGRTHNIALVQPYDRRTGIRTRRERQLGLFRVAAQSRKDAQFFFVNSIIRGALLAADVSQKDKWQSYFVMDTVDTDMFLRVKELF